jgi:hypothetical protein
MKKIEIIKFHNFQKDFKKIFRKSWKKKLRLKIRMETKEIQNYCALFVI